MELVRIHARVRGMVQGVGFRYEAMRLARRARITGWVANRFDGSVELEAQGSRDAVTVFVDWLHHGPRWSRVTAVEVRPIPAIRGEGSFSVR